MLPLLLRPPASCMEAALAGDTGEVLVYSGRWQTWGWKGSASEPSPKTSPLSYQPSLYDFCLTSFDSILHVWFLFTFQPLEIVLQAQEGTEAKEHSCLLQFLLGAVEEVGLQMGNPGDGMTPGGLRHCQRQPAEGVEGLGAEGRAWRSSVSGEAQQSRATRQQVTQPSRPPCAVSSGSYVKLTLRST